MSDLRKAAQAALDALDGLSEDAVCQSSHHAKKDRHTSLDVCPVFLRVRAAITTLRAALAEPSVPSDCPDSHQPQRKPLDDLAIADIYTKWDATSGTSMADFARAIERAHGIGGKP